jgi:hypothetical protein
MHKDIKEFSEILFNGRFETTYKLIWAKAIVESCLFDPVNNYIQYENIGKIMCRYYWNQIILFPNFNQFNPEDKQSPVLITALKKIRDQYILNTGLDISKGREMRFEKIENQLNINWKNITKILKTDVAKRFQNVPPNRKFQIYKYDAELDYILVYNPSVISEYGEILLSLINYKLIQKLESFNPGTNRISDKIRVIDQMKPIRRDLKKYHKYLDVLGKKCFWCNENKNEKFTIDHVLPFSKMPEDFIWNFVYSHQSCNSSKNSSIISLLEMDRLHSRNIVLLDTLLDFGFNIESDNNLKELKNCIENNTLKKRWTQIF